MLRIGIAPCAEGIQRLAGMPDWLARLLHARGIRTDEEARRFLNPGMDQIALPGSLPGMEKALQLLRDAKKQGKKAAIFGDYDVDGVCASAILKEAFTFFGLDCRVYIPHRHEEGYGLNIPAVEKLAADCQLLVTVDCGITGIEEVAAAKRAGMQVIVTDHHKPGEMLPDADAVISPLLSDYPFPYLCGAGVAWKLAWGLIGKDAIALMELAALATIADMVPLTGENRSIVSLGLKQLSHTRRPGLRAVMENAGLRGALTSEQAAFQIAPRMNACGRMESAGIALDMLLTGDKNEAAALAAKMEQLNQERKNQEAAVVGEALAQVEKMDLIATRGLVVTGENWNSGVVGLAAGKIAEKYTCPAVVLSREGDVCVGSARSAGNVDVHKALSQCADLFIRFGGHRQAAGLTLEYANVPEFARRFSKAVQEQTGDRALIPQLLCDGEMHLEDVTEETVALLSRLEPFGMGNPAPRFLCEGVKALSLRPVGSMGKHLKCTFQQGNALRDGIFFGGGDWAGSDGASFRMVMTPVINEFRGQIHAECQLQALQLLPERILHQPAREAAAFLSEEMGQEAAEEITFQELPRLMQGNQGTLLVCRCLKTALKMREMFPDADFSMEKALDPKAYHTVLLYGTAESTCASYRYVVLCDGSLGDAAAYKKACPNAEIYALNISEEMRMLLSGMYVDVLKLRECYRQMKEETCRDLPAFACLFGLKEEQTAFVLKVFAMLGLADVSFCPFRAVLRPMIKCNPEENPLFRLARHAKEEHDGVYGL